MSISEALGRQHDVKLPQGTVRYRERGEGEPIVFVHGLLVNGDLWRKVVPLLADGHRCITPDWPLGSHEVPLNADADLTPPGLARLIADFLGALDLRDVTLVSNDTGTALTQLVATLHPERVGRIVLTTGDAFDNFPPKMFKPMIGLGYLPGAVWLLDKTGRPNAVRKAIFGPLAKNMPAAEILESFGGNLRQRGVQRDLKKVLRAVRSRYTQEAAEKLPDLQAPALMVWAPEDKFFPNSDAKRLAELIPDGRVVWIEDSRAFVSEDQPERTAGAIGRFMAERPIATVAG
jgi:pimeloyl-ACP methyl ester carboxylesterase